MRKKTNGKKELAILAAVVVLGIGIFAAVQIFMNGVSDGGFSNYTKTIDADEYFEKLANGDDFILVYGADSCSACAEFKVTVGTVMKGDYEDIPVFYFDADKASEEDKTKVATYLKISGTPTSYLYISGSEVSTLAGSADAEQVKIFFEKYKSYR